MKKKFPLLIIILSALVLITACSAPPEQPFSDLLSADTTLPAYESTTYSITLAQYYEPNSKDPIQLLDDPVILNDVGQSYWKMTFERERNADDTDFTSNATLTSESVAVYKDGGRRDEMRSTVRFDATSRTAFPLRPLSVEKSMSFGRDEDKWKDYSYEFDYSTGEGSGKIYGRNHYGVPTLFDEPVNVSVRVKNPGRNLANVYDNEQLFYLMTSATARIMGGQVTGRWQNFKVFNVYENMLSGAGAATLSFNALDFISEINDFTQNGLANRSPFNQVAFGDIKTPGVSNIAPVQLGIASGSGTFSGGSIEAYYSVAPTEIMRPYAEAIEADEGEQDPPPPFSFPDFRLLGYRQGITNSAGMKLSAVCFSVIDYTRER